MATPQKHTAPPVKAAITPHALGGCNAARFPNDFMFKLSLLEFADLKSQFATSSWGGKRKPLSKLQHKPCAQSFWITHELRITTLRRATNSNALKEFAMPTPSIFFGIIIRMWHDDHPPPHLHAECSTQPSICRAAPGHCSTCCVTPTTSPVCSSMRVLCAGPTGWRFPQPKFTNYQLSISQPEPWVVFDNSLSPHARANKAN